MYIIYEGRTNPHNILYTGDWSNGMIGVSKTFGGSSILSSPARGKAGMLEKSGVPVFLFYREMKRNKDRYCPAGNVALFWGRFLSKYMVQFT